MIQGNTVIFCEMMSHTALFAHTQPKSIGLIGDNRTHPSILPDILKHSQLESIQYINAFPPSFTNDTRVQHQTLTWLENAKANSLDVIISLDEPRKDLLTQYYHALQKEGILLQLAGSFFDIETLKSLSHLIKSIGFHDLHILHFPEPDYPSGFRTAIIAIKYGVFKRPREKAIYNKSFKTHYYNFDIHRASMVLPEFMRDTVI